MGRVKIRVKFIAVLPQSKKITMYIYNALALNKFLRNSEYPKDLLSSHFFSSVVVFVSPAKHIAAHTNVGITLSGVCLCVWPVEIFSW